MKDFFQLRQELQLREATSPQDHFDNVAKNHEEKAADHSKTQKAAFTRAKAAGGGMAGHSKSHIANLAAYHAHQDAARHARKAADAHYKDPNAAKAATAKYHKAAAVAKQHSQKAREAEAEDLRNKDK